MCIETLIAISLVVSITVIAIISLLSCIAKDEVLVKERKANDRLQEENKKLRNEVYRLQSKISLVKLYAEMEKK